jgi:Skp family chaperone for outer membrane proteins
VKLADLQAFGVRYGETKTQREAELRAQASRVNKSVLDDVMTATRDIDEKEGFNLILNASRANPVVSDVLFAKNVEDVTEKVLASLNTTKIREAVPPRH